MWRGYPERSGCSGIQRRQQERHIELSRELMTISKKARDGKLTRVKCRAVASPSPASAAWVLPLRADCERAGSGYPRRFQVRMEPVWNGKEFVPRLMLPISLPSTTA